MSDWHDEMMLTSTEVARLLDAQRALLRLVTGAALIATALDEEVAALGADA
jgi:hypothetical protein